MGMKSVEFKIVGGQSQEPFTCTGCGRKCDIGADGLELHILEGGFGPLCVDCWPKLSTFAKELASRPGMVIDVAAITEQVMSRYQAAKARGN